jgi:succinoglycan biosynthesis transport protein ExoP
MADTDLVKPAARAPESPDTISEPSYGEKTESIIDVPFMAYWQILRRRKWTIACILLLVLAAVGITTLRQRPVYQAKAVIYIDRESPNIFTLRDLADYDPSDETYFESAYKLLQSRTLARRVIADLKLDQTVEFRVAKDDASSDAVSSFLAGLTITPIRGSRLVEIHFESYDRQLAARVANALAANFIDQNLEVKWTAAQKASGWLSHQLVGLKANLEKSEDGLQRYARENSILLIDEKQTMVGQKLKDVQDEYLRAEGERIHKESVYKRIQAKTADSVPGLLESSSYQQLTMKLADLKQQYAELSVSFSADYPKLKRLKAQIDDCERSIEKERNATAGRVADEYHAAVTRSDLLKHAVEAQTREYNDIAAKSVQYGILKREVDTNRQIYDGLLQRLKEAGVSAGMKATNIRVVDAAEVPRWPSTPRIPMNLLMGLLSGLGLGIGLALFQEYIDDAVNTPEEVQRYLNLPTLGVIPAAASNGSRGTDAAPYDSMALLEESYRCLRTSVLLSRSGHSPRVILVASGLPGEGKTTTVANFGIVLAQLGKRVLVLDADMRRPKLGSTLKMQALPRGLSTHLTGYSSLEESVVPTQVPNLSVMLCGPSAPNPAELLASSTFVKLLSEAREKFDYLVLDSPPVLRVADARILATQADAVMLVVHGGETSRKSVSQAKMELQRVNANVIGVVLNNVDLSKPGYYYEYSHYRDAYAYGVYGSDHGNGRSTPTKQGSSALIATLAPIAAQAPIAPADVVNPKC